MRSSAHVISVGTMHELPAARNRAYGVSMNAIVESHGAPTDHDWWILSIGHPGQFVNCPYNTYPFVNCPYKTLR